MVKPASAGKSQACAPVELSGVVGDSAYRERSRGTWEIRRAGVLTKKAQLGIHNQLVLHGRKSEGVVVAGKRGNSRGAKGPCWQDAESETCRAACEKSPLRYTPNCTQRQKLYLEVKPGAKVLDGLGLGDVFCVVGASANIARATPR